MADSKVFRKVSLDRLSSPEELDQRLTVTSPIGWVAFAAVAGLVFAGLIWGFSGSIADKAMGEGIIMSSGGITRIIHHADGQITDVSVQDGDYVEKGDVIARVKQTDLINEINKYKEDLAVIRSLDFNNPQLDSSMLNFNIYGKIMELSGDIELAGAQLAVQKANLITAEKNRAIELENANWELAQAKIRHEESLENYNVAKVLYESGAGSLNDFKEAERTFILGESGLRTKMENLQQLQTEANQLPRSEVDEAETNLNLLRQRFRDTGVLLAKDLDQTIAKMQRDLINNSEIVAGVSGRILELQLKKGDLVQAGQNVCSIARERKEMESLEAVIYVPVEQGKKIIPGMEVNICPSTVKKEEHGFMLGNIVSVSKYPVSAQGMMLTLGNNELVRRLSGEGAPIEVKVELIIDNSTASGYKWSTPDGPPLVIDSGTLCVGEVKVARQKPISMVIPFIKKVLPI
ncbi:MAG: NHLP bacteriocin system secretion protein [Heliobacteriaceae bacterium]|nr:NHLP bacteriocin system secretion protein [Heliobacteriaceae bacterium]MDD4587160.1 NHLP bacteriocin system secretion protein [Heliobacteriaceae bacterium]